MLPGRSRRTPGARCGNYPPSVVLRALAFVTTSHRPSYHRLSGCAAGDAAFSERRSGFPFRRPIVTNHVSAVTCASAFSSDQNLAHPGPVGVASVHSAPHHNTSSLSSPCYQATWRSKTIRCLAAAASLPTAPAAPRERWFPIAPVGADALRSYLLRSPTEQRPSYPARHSSGSVYMSPVLNSLDRPQPRTLQRKLLHQIVRIGMRCSELESLS